MKQIMEKTIGRISVFLAIAIALTVVLYKLADPHYQNDSEGFAMGPIVASVQNIDIDKEGYGLGKLTSLEYPKEDVYSFMEKNSDMCYEYEVYKSQVGLQGYIYAFLANIFPMLGIYKVLRMICVFLLVIVIMLIIVQLYKRYGMLFSAIFAMVTFVSPWVINFSRNLYWVEFTWFIPMLLGLLCLNYEKAKRIIYPLYTVAIFIKSLCGYEYLSTIMMAGIMFFIVEFICYKESRKEIFKTVAIIGICSVVGFVLALLVHSYMYGNGNIIDGIKLIQVDLIERRTFGDASNYDSVYANSLNASILDVLVKYFWDLGGPFNGKFVAILAITTTMALLFQRIILKEINTFEISVFFVTLLTTASWLVLGKSHSYIHTELNVVLFCMGWCQVCVYIMCKTLLHTINRMMKKE